MLSDADVVLGPRQMVDGYEQQLKVLAARSPAGLSVSTAMHAASTGAERFKKGDCRGASRLLRCAASRLPTPLNKLARGRLQISRSLP